MAITYLLTLGAEFDLVINLDGVNEAALPKIDNVPHGVSATFPRKWQVMTASSASLEFMRRVGYVTYLKQQQQDWAARFERFPWKYSPTGLLLWKIGNDRREWFILQQLNFVATLHGESASYGILGPPEKFDSDREIYNYCVEIWAPFFDSTASDLRRKSNAIFPFSPAQSARPAFDQAHARCGGRRTFTEELVSRTGHPVLSADAAHEPPSSLARESPFATSPWFSNHPEPIYNDDCCHMYEAGGRDNGPGDRQIDSRVLSRHRPLTRARVRSRGSLTALSIFAIGRRSATQLGRRHQP